MGAIIPNAAGLQDATGAVNVSQAAAPTIGQVLTATSATAADWQTPAAGGGTGTPGGTSGQLQYNAAGAFGGVGQSSVDNTKFFLGLQVATPLHRLHVLGNLQLDQVTAAANATYTPNVDSTAGQLGAGYYTYTITFVTPEGETNWANSLNGAANDATHTSNNITNLPIGGADVTERKIYRGTINGASSGPFYLVTTIADNTTTTYTDTMPDTTLTTHAGAPTINTTGGAIYQGTNRVAYFNSLNLILGSLVANSITKGTDNVFVGAAIGNATISTANQNTALGWAPLNVLTTGSANVAIGYNCTAALTTGGYNTAMGFNALDHAVTASYNTAVGSSALLNTTGAENTSIGLSAGLTNTTGANNTYLGATADCSVNSLSNTTAIGYGATVAASNTMQYGNSSIVAHRFTSGTMFAPASTTALASLNVASGTAPTTPNNGDIWFDGTNIKIQVGGVTKTFTIA